MQRQVRLSATSGGVMPGQIARFVGEMPVRDLLGGHTSGRHAIDGYPLAPNNTEVRSAT